MNEPRPEPSAVARLRNGLVGLASGLLVAGFVVAFSSRPVTVLANAAIDDALFMKLGQQLASGRWLGPYDALTLAKGPGFPAFLALANITGLAYPLALALTYAASAGFASVVAARLARSAWAGLAMLAALLLAPMLYDSDFLGVFRDFFYMSICVALVSAAIALATNCLGRRRLLAVVTGVLGAWVWLTREEGVWLVPALGLLALIPLLGLDRNAEPDASFARRARRLAAPCLALGVAASLIVGFGLVNWLVYGRFQINEIKDATFQSAMSALQDASAPYHKTGVPVPAAARARIYAVSPAFASLKEPVLDGPQTAEATQWGCRENPKMCGDFGGGWFFWALRGSAAAKGHHANPDEAAAFYATLAKEVRTACDDGRLECRPWRVPLVPPMTLDELADVGASLGRVAEVLTFAGKVNLQLRPSNLEGPGGAALPAFLNLPGAYYGVAERRMSGWFVGQGEQWFTLQPQAGVGSLTVERSVSPDLVGHFDDPRLGRQRFTLKAECPPSQPCPALMVLDGGPATPVDLAALKAGAHQIGGAQLYLDDVGGDGSASLLKVRLSNIWLHAETKLPRLYRGLLLAGGLAYLVVLAQIVARRRLTAGAVICTALLASVCARAVILAIIDALSFRAASKPYALPGMILLVMFSVYALQQAAAGFRRGRRTEAEPEAAEAYAVAARAVEGKEAA